jgi:hypothetical protein
MNHDADLERAIDTAWHVHGALGDWTGRVDVKASIFLTLEAAVLAAILDASGKDGRLSDQAINTKLENVLYWGGLCLISLSILLAAAVVTPQLRRYQTRKAGTEWRRNLVYFGHLRHWEPGDLKKELLKQSDALDSLSRQLIRMSEICWRKHSWAQASMISAVLGAVVIVWCSLLVG